MCGLFGVVANPDVTLDMKHARAARDSLLHRGPDQAGEWTNGGNIYVGHRRLSIIDTSSAGRQPLVDGQTNVTVNGEIYNYRMLRNELISAGYEFRSGSDSEVILHGYREWGIDLLLTRLEGMYACVIYDGANRCLHAFRDRIGIKPLYYYNDGETFAWASELKALERYFPSGLTTDPEAIIDFLTYRYVPAPKSLYKNVAKLPAASLLTLQLDNKALQTERYWRLPDPGMNESDAELPGIVVESLRETVTSQLVSDVPLGLLLSGGLDSAIIAKLAGQEVSDLQAYTVGFGQAGRDETPLARVMAKAAALDHHTAEFPVDSMTDLATRMRSLFDEPFGDTSALPTHQVCHFARQGITVALSGDGGDELFGGYRWYERYSRLADSLKKWPWRPARGWTLPEGFPLRNRLALHSLGDPLWLYAVIRGSLLPQQLAAWKRRLGVDPGYDELWAYRQVWQPRLVPGRAAQVMDFHTYLPDDILTKVDRVSMAVSLECRPALLSSKSVEMAFRLPTSFTYLNKQLKGGLREAFADILPSEILAAEKQGFSVPDTGWRALLVDQFGSLQEALLQPYLSQATMSQVTR